MSAHFGLFLGDDRIPVINWINRHGPPEGRDLRFTLPTEAKAKIEANIDATFRLERDGKQWEFEIVSVTQHCTGTNGLPTIGRVKAKGLGERSEITFGKRPKTGLTLPKLDGSPSEGSIGKRDPSGLKAALLKKKKDSEAAAEPPTETGLPGADEVNEPATEKGHPAVEPGAKEEE